MDTESMARMATDLVMACMACSTNRQAAGVAERFLRRVRRETLEEVRSDRDDFTSEAVVIAERLEQFADHIGGKDVIEESLIKEIAKIAKRQARSFIERYDPVTIEITEKLKAIDVEEGE